MRIKFRESISECSLYPWTQLCQRDAHDAPVQCSLPHFTSLTSYLYFSWSVSARNARVMHTRLNSASAWHIRFRLYLHSLILQLCSIFTKQRLYVPLNSNTFYTYLHSTRSVLCSLNIGVWVMLIQLMHAVLIYNLFRHQRARNGDYSAALPQIFSILNNFVYWFIYFCIQIMVSI